MKRIKIGHRFFGSSDGEADCLINGKRTNMSDYRLALATLSAEAPK